MRKEKPQSLLSIYEASANAFILLNANGTRPQLPFYDNVGRLN